MNIKLSNTASSTNLRIKIIGVKNSFSQKPNNPITISTYTIENYQQSQNLDTIIIINTIDSPFSSFSPSFDPRIYGSSTKITMTMRPTN